jgi:hypothetical protein
MARIGGRFACGNHKLQAQKRAEPPRGGYGSGESADTGLSGVIEAIGTLLSLALGPRSGKIAAGNTGKDDACF